MLPNSLTWVLEAEPGLLTATSGLCPGSDLLCVQFQSNESGFFFKKDTLKYSFSQMSHKFQSNESASGFAGADFIRLFRSL